MAETLYAIYGASGFGREVMPLAVNYFNKKGIDRGCLFFIDDGISEDEVNGCKVVKYSDFKKLNSDSKKVSLAIADSRTRSKLADLIENDGMKSWQLKHENVVELFDVSIKEGAILCPFVTLTSNINIGKCFHANIYSYVAHDCRIGDFVTFAPGVKCNGNVVVEDHAYIGTGAVIKQGTPGRPLIIGEGAVVGMGAVVTRSVLAGDTVIGNPAKSLSRKNLRSK